MSDRPTIAFTSGCFDSKPGRGRTWLKEHVQILRDRYPEEGASSRLADDLHRTKDAIAIKARSVGLEFEYSPVKWTKEQEITLIERYGKEGVTKSLEEALSKSTWSIRAKAQQLGLKIDSQEVRVRKISTGCGRVTGGYMATVRRSAVDRKLDMDIDAEYVWAVFQAQNGKCALSCLDLTLEKRDRRSQQTASLDRIDSNKGYIKGNVQWVHKVVNKMKNILPDGDFIRFCNHVAKCNPLS